MDKYDCWIAGRLAGGENPYGKCAELTLEMQADFPELIRVCGHYYCTGWGEREHWWLKTPDGVIVDPTKEQFPSKGHGPYVELDKDAPIPTGMCPNCGEYCYTGGTLCSDKCEREYTAYLMGT